jgi:hypothetical protein
MAGVTPRSFAAGCSWLRTVPGAVALPRLWLRQDDALATARMVTLTSSQPTPTSTIALRRSAGYVDKIPKGGRCVTCLSNIGQNDLAQRVVLCHDPGPITCHQAGQMSAP